MIDLNNTEYRAAYAQHAPVMRARWNGCTNAAKLDYAKQDIYASMKVTESESYMGRLYAELDAIRDAEHAMTRRRA
jgi:hypothetical protein